MENTLNAKSEKIKSNIKDSAEKSKDTMKEIIDSNSKHIDNALNSNKKIVDSIKEKLDQQEIEDSVTDTLKTSFGKSVELAEDALDSIINSYSSQMELNIDYNTKLVDALKESKNENPEKVLELIYGNFEASRQMIINNTKEILNFYNKHTNIAMDFNQKFGDNVKAQIETLYSMQNKSMDKFTSWASEWSKQK